MKSEKSYFILLLAVGSVILFAHLGLLYVDIMEARNFVSAREMAHEGHWIFTTMNDLPRYEKPPLPTWLSAFMGMLFGFDHIGALRIPAALVCFAALIYLYKIVVFVTKKDNEAVVCPPSHRPPAGAAQPVPDRGGVLFPVAALPSVRRAVQETPDTLQTRGC